MSNDASCQLLELNIISAQDLYSVGRSMRTYAVAWIDPDRKVSTRVDSDAGNNPTWNDKFAFRIDHNFLYNHDSLITIDIYALHWFKDIHVGTVHLLLTDLFPSPTQTQKNTYKSTGMRFMGLQVQRPSGRPKGILNIGAAIIDTSLRSMPLSTDDFNKPTHQPKPELRRIKSDSSSMLGSEPDYQPKNAKSQDTTSTFSGSDIKSTPKWGKFGRKNSKKTKNNLNARLSLDYQLKSTPNRDFLNATPKPDFPNSTPKRDFQFKSTPKRDFPNSTPMRDFPNSTPKRDFQFKSTPKRDFPNTTPKQEFQIKSMPKREFPNSTPKREFPNSTPKREFPNSTPKQEFQIKSTPKREFPNNTPIQEFQVKSTPEREFPNSTPMQEFELKSTPKRDFPNSTPMQEFQVKSTPKREFPNSTPMQEFQVKSTPKREFSNSTPMQEFQVKSTPKREFPNSTPKQEFQIKSTPKREFPNSTPKQEFEKSPVRTYNKAGNVKATPLHAFAVKKAALEYGTPYRANMSARPIMMTNSELGPSASEVAAIMAREEVDDEEEDSTVEGWSLDENSQPKAERWQSEYDGSDRTSTKNGKNSRKKTEPGNGLFSCFSVICGVECSIVCGGDAATSKKKKKNRRRRGVQSVDNESFV